MLKETTDSRDLLWMIVFTCVIALGYIILTAISFRVYKRLKRHFAIQFSISKEHQRQDLLKESISVENGFKTRLYLQLILAFFLHINLFFILAEFLHFFEWWYVYVCIGLFLISLFFTYRALVYIDKRKARKSEDELIQL